MEGKSHEMIDRIFWSTKDFDGFESLCEVFRGAKSACVMTDEEGGRPFSAPYIYTCSCCGVTLADDNWNCVAFTEENVISVRPVSNDYFVYTLEIETCCEVYPRLTEEEPESHIVRLSFYSIDRRMPHEDKKTQDARSDDESYKAFDIGLNRLFMGIYDLETLGWFCDSVMAVYDATSDPDEAIVMLTINERVQDPMASSVTVNELSFDGNSLTITAEDGNGEALTVRLAPERVSGVERIACVNNSFYCVQVELTKRPGELQSSYLQIGIFL